MGNRFEPKPSTQTALDQARAILAERGELSRRILGAVSIPREAARWIISGLLRSGEIERIRWEAVRGGKMAIYGRPRPKPGKSGVIAPAPHYRGLTGWGQ